MIWVWTLCCFNKSKLCWKPSNLKCRTLNLFLDIWHMFWLLYTPRMLGSIGGNPRYRGENIMRLNLDHPARNLAKFHVLHYFENISLLFFIIVNILHIHKCITKIHFKPFSTYLNFCSFFSNEQLKNSNTAQGYIFWYSPYLPEAGGRGRI